MNRSAIVAGMLVVGVLGAAAHGGAQPIATAQTTAPSQTGDFRIMGRLQMEDGAALPRSALVEYACNGRIKKRVPPLANGDFNFVLGSDTSETPDISAPGELFTPAANTFDPRPVATREGTYDGQRFDQTVCEVRGVLPGYVSTTISLGPRRMLDQPNVGDIVLHKIFVPDKPVLSANTLAATSRARTAYDNAWEFISHEKPDYEKAARELQKATADSPNFSAAWDLLGRVRLALNDVSIAREVFQKAIDTDSTNVDPYIHLARVDAQLNEWADAARLTAAAQKLNAFIPDANYLNAMANFQLQEFDAAEKSALEVLKAPNLDDYPMVFYILATSDAMRGDFESATRQLRRFLATKLDQDTADRVRKILADWEEKDAGGK